MTDREELLDYVSQLEDEVRVPAHSDPWTEIQTWTTMLTPAMADAGLLWEYTGASSEGIFLESGEGMGGFWVLDETIEQFVAMRDLDDVLSLWIPLLREQIENAATQQIKRYALWAGAIVQR